MLVLSFCQRSPAPRAAVAELLDQLRHQVSGERRLALQHVGERMGETSWVHLLEQVSRCPRAERGEEMAVLPGDGEHHDLRLRQTCADLPGRGDACTGHVHVEQADVWLGHCSLLDRRRRVRGLCDYPEALMGLEDFAHLCPRRCVVVRDEDANRPGGHCTTTSMRVPSLGDVSTRRSAPSSCARSRIVCRPNPW